MSKNVSEIERKVIVQPKREVPYEICFQLSDAKQDQQKKNRYWFKYPAQWNNRYDKDSIIGIRSIYLTKTNLLIMYDFTVELLDCITLERVYGAHTVVVHFLEGVDTVEKIAKRFDGWWINNLVPGSNNKINIEWEPYELHATYEYDEDRNRMSLIFGRGFDDRHNMYIRRDGIKYLPRITVRPINDDTCNIFGTREAKTEIGYVSFDVWSRFNCYVKSSIAELDMNNFIGHTGHDYQPIKYYRLTSNDKRFWVELYETRFHDCPVEIPPRDDIFIEAVVLFDADSII